MTVSVEHLFFSYEKQSPVLEDISFSIEQGQFIGIFGPNGGGKTTLLNHLLGQLKPDRGTVKILDQSPSKVSHKIGYVPQVRRYDKQFPISTFEVVLQGCLSEHRGWGNFTTKTKQQAMEALEKVGLQDKAQKALGTLASGQIQRALIARALACNPEILLLDEATVGVDPHALAEFFAFLIQLKKSITTLLVTHDLHAIAKDMDHLLCINRNLTHYTPAQVCEHFAMGLYHPKLMKKEKKDD